MQNNTKKKSTRLYIILLAFPIPALILTTVIFGALGLIFGEPETVFLGDGSLEIERSLPEAVFRFLLSIVAGAAIICLVLFPLWIVALTINGNKNKQIDSMIREQEMLRAAGQYQQQSNYVQPGSENWPQQIPPTNGQAPQGQVQYRAVPQQQNIQIPRQPIEQYPGNQQIGQ